MIWCVCVYGCRCAIYIYMCISLFIIYIDNMHVLMCVEALEAFHQASHQSWWLFQYKASVFSFQGAQDPYI